MKKILYLLLIVPLLSFAQSFTIEYDVSLNVLNRTGFLQYNKNETSFYYEKIKEVIEKDEKNQEVGTLNKTIYLGKNSNEVRVQIYDRKKDTLVCIDYLEGKEVICTEKFPLMDWKLENETKLIANYLCSKATTNFRGRKYIAWYCSDLPIQVGPWKFNNLPGAIFQVYDETNDYYWSATKISKKTEDEKYEIDKNLKKISLQEYIDQDEKFKEQISNKAVLKFVERGAEVLESKYHRGRETKFEWEK
ncbi:MAG: GLPGLI family protein [Flavobacterium sp.]